jgi:Domain of unknown function (DUF4460)
MSSSIRKCLTGFFKAVHPDVLGKVPDEARQINTRAVQELNAYIDRLEASETENYPTVARDVGFFKKSFGRSGRELPVLKHCTVRLHSIPPGTDFLQKEAISIRLIRDLELLINSTDTLFKSIPTMHETIEPIITRPGQVRKDLNDLWERETRHEQIKMALFETEDLPSAKREAYARYVRETVTQRLTHKYSKIGTTRIRKMKLAKVAEKSDAEVFKRCIPVDKKVYVDEQEAEVHQKAKVLHTGYHPDLVFFDPSLTDDQRNEGMQRVCGMHLAKEEDTWLLENVWKVMRTGSIPVPVVLGNTYSIESSKGFVTIKHDFDLTDLVDFLEEHLQRVRDEREILLREAKIAI